MAYNTLLAERLRAALKRHPGITEQNMFGGVCFLLHGNMLVGIWKDSLIARLGPEVGTAALSQPHVGPMDITGKPMKGWVIIAPAGLSTEADIKSWVTLAIQFVKGLEPKGSEKKADRPKTETRKKT
jgi:TfoX N-terminal domain